MQDIGNNQSGEKRRDHPKQTKALVLMPLGHMITHWYVGVLLVVVPFLKKDFSLSFTEVGLIFSLRSLAGAVGNATAGIAADFVGKRTSILVLSVSGVALCWLIIGFAQVYLLLLIVLPLAHMSANLWHAPAISTLSEAYPERRGLAFGIHGAAGNLGQSISPLVVGFLITYVGWRTAIKANVPLAILLAVLLVIFLPRLGTFSFKKRTKAEFMNLLKNQLLRNKTLFFIAVISFLRTMAQNGVQTFLPLFLAERLGLSPAWVGVYLSVLTFSATFPEPLMGWLSDFVGRKSILWISFTLGGLSAIAITLVKPGPSLIISLVALGFSLFTLRSIILAFALDVTPPEIGGSTVSYVFTWNQTVAVLSPLVGGFLADVFGIEFALYFIAFLIFTGALFVSAIKPMERRA